VCVSDRERHLTSSSSPPVAGLLFKICTSIQSWLDADSDNVAVIHCLTGRGRTAAVTACVLTWMGEFSSPSDALEYVAARKCMSVEQLTIPSQRRYVQYFGRFEGDHVYVMSCHAMSCAVMSCHVLCCDVMCCDVL